MDRDEHLYEDDFYAWTQVQASKLRQAADARVNLDLDFANLAEEVEDLGKSERDAVQSALMRVVEHLLKLEHSPAGEPRRGWRASVTEHRTRAARKLKQNPSFKGQLADLFAEAWEDGRTLAVEGLAEDGIPPEDIPQECPYSFDQIRDQGWYPANRHGLP